MGMIKAQGPAPAPCLGLRLASLLVDEYDADERDTDE